MNAILHALAAKLGQLHAEQGRALLDLYGALFPVPTDPPAVDPPTDPPTTLPFELAPAFVEGPYAYLGWPELPADYELGGWFGHVGHKGTLPSEWSNKAIVNNDAAAPHGEHGPKWQWRTYDTQGVLKKVHVIRAGDFTKGREGHAFYANVLGPLLIEDFVAEECGGQGIQLVWRASETTVPESEWLHRLYEITLRRCHAIDCGLINEGAAVRASWPFSIFSPGQRVHLQDCSVEQIDAPIGHGALFVGDGPTRTPHLLVEGLRVRLKNSDRAAVRLHDVELAILDQLDLIGDNRVAFTNDCGRVEIHAPRQAVEVLIHHAGPGAHHAPYETHDVPAGATWAWARGEVAA